MKLADLERHLRPQGCVLKRQGGAYAIWENPTNRAWTAVPRHRKIRDYLARRICRQLEIPEQEEPRLFKLRIEDIFSLDEH